MEPGSGLRIEGPAALSGKTFSLNGGTLALVGGGLAALPDGQRVIGPRGGEVLVLGSMILWIWYSRAAMARLRTQSDLAISGLTFAAGTAIAMNAVSARILIATRMALTTALLLVPITSRPPITQTIRKASRLNEPPS